MSDDLDKTIEKLGVGKQEAPHRFNYDHLLDPQHIAQGYSLRVTVPSEDDYVTHLYHNGQKVGKLESGRSPRGHETLMINDATIKPSEPDHRGKGLGVKMYEATYAHAKNKLGYTHVSGHLHSTLASRVHSSLAQKHGLMYEPEPSGISNAPGPYDNRMAPYRYELNEQDLTKAIKNLQPGKITSETGDSHIWDYNHLLPPHLKQAGYSMHIEEPKMEGGEYTVEVKHPSMSPAVDHIAGRLNLTHDANSRSITPEIADVHDAHRGAGLGTSMYEAAMAHGYHIHDARVVAGDKHSSSASAVHAKVSQKHGMGYQPKLNPKAPPKVGDYDAKYAPYSYAMKSDEFCKTFNDWLGKLEGGRAEGMPDKEFDSGQLEEGTQHEMEHTNDPKIARGISKDHLAEDPKYYTKLKQIE